MRDPRVALGYAAAVALLVGAAWRRAAGQAEWLLLGVAALSFALWCRLFGIYRYLVVLEMLAPVLVMVALARLGPRALLPGMAVAAILCLWTTIRPDWGHVRTGAQLLSVEPMPVGDGDLLVFSDDEPQAYLVPFMPADVRAVGVGNNLVRPEHDHGLNRRIRAVIAGHAGRAWSVSVAASPDAKRDAILAAYGLQVVGECYLVRTSMERAGHRFCPVVRAG